ncbi:type II toxin-antitoxin system VapB family antitoxin, partial [Candidatus Marithrix sp. Canyon 246]
MKTSLNIDDSLLDNASELTGITDKNALIKAGLEVLLTKQYQQRVFDHHIKKPYVTPNKALSQLINHYGTCLCEDPKRCEALLRDSCGGKHQREISLLVNAL